MWLSECVVDTVLAVGSWRKLFQHQLRRARTNRSHRPISYFFTVVTQGVLWAIVNLLVGGFGVLALSAALLTIGVRLASVALVSRRLRVPFRVADVLLVLLTDVLQISVWALGFLGNSVWWSGRRFRILKSGEMQALPVTSFS